LNQVSEEFLFNSEVVAEALLVTLRTVALTRDNLSGSEDEQKYFYLEIHFQFVLRLNLVKVGIGMITHMKAN
jgi:hypothetical protein